MSNLTNGTPRVEDQGIRDMPRAPRAIPPLSIPQHLPLVYTYAEKGPVGRHYLDLDISNFIGMYGDKTVEAGSIYESTQTPFITTFTGHGNNMSVHRVVPTDAKDRPNLGVYLDVIKTKVPVYERNPDGGFKLNEFFEKVQVVDGTGAPVEQEGILFLWSIDKTEAPLGTYKIGRLKQRPGLINVDATNSLQYPLFEFAHKQAGSGGMDLAVVMDTINSLDFEDFSPDFFNRTRQAMYRFTLKKGFNDETGASIKVAENRFGEHYSKVVFGKNIRNPINKGIVSMDDLVTRDYIKVTEDISSGLGEIFMYHDNIKAIATMIKETETGATYDGIDEFFDDYKDNPDEYGFVDILRMCNSNGIPYQSVQLVNPDLIDMDSARGDKGFGTMVPMNGISPLRFDGGFDGTMTKEAFEAHIRSDMDNYLNPLHVYNNIVNYPESDVYDSGFSMDTKFSLIKMIGRRKDTFVNLATGIEGENLNVSEQYSAGIALASRVSLYPESALFGTPAARGIIMAGTGTIIGSDYTKRVPTTLELAHKASRFMGAKNGKWKPNYFFDHGDASVIEKLEDLDIVWIPVSTRNDYWIAGINFPNPYEIGQIHFPSLQTVYTDDTSVLNNYFVVKAACFGNKMSHRIWRRWSGVSGLSGAQLTDRVNEDFNKDNVDRFADVVRIEPHAMITETDDINGNSWTFAAKLYGHVSRTVMTAYLEAYRENTVLN